MGLLDDRVIIVTGGGRGLGRAHCLELAAHGATVVVNDLGVDLGGQADAASPADEVVEAIRSAGGTATADGTSVTDFDAVEALVARTVAEHGRLDAVVNNAGILRDRMLTSMSEAEFDDVVQVHLKGTFCLTRHACAHWRSVSKAGGTVTGRIVNTTSGTGLFGTVGQANYGAAKAGIANLTTITALEMERYGVTANAVSPVARTRMTEAVPSIAADHGEDEFDRFDPANASPVVAWLTSEASGWLSGAVLRIEGDTVQRVRPWQADPAVSFRTGAGRRLDATTLDRGVRRALGAFPSGTTTTSS